MRGWIICKRCWLIFGRDEVTPNAEVSGAGTASAGLPGSVALETEDKR